MKIFLYILQIITFICCIQCTSIGFRIIEKDKNGRLLIFSAIVCIIWLNINSWYIMPLLNNLK